MTVSVGFSTRLPLSDLKEDTLAETQRDGRRFIYRMARDECEVLRTIIAHTCSLTNLNISAQIQQPGRGKPNTLYLNGTANFSIGLRSEDRP